MVRERLRANEWIIAWVFVLVVCVGVSAQNIELIGSIPDAGSNSNLRLNDGYLYRFEGRRFDIYQASNLLNLTLLSSTDFSWYISDYDVANGIGYFWLDHDENDSILIVDLTNPETPVTIGYFTPINQIINIAADSSFIYMVSHDSLYAVDGSAPSSPVIAGRYGSAAFIYDLLIDSKHAYLLTTLGVEILDIANPAVITKVGEISGSVAKLQVKNNYLYTNRNWNYFDIYDVSDVSTPVKLGGITTDSNLVLIQLNNTGTLALIFYSNNRYGVIDIADPDNPLMLGFLPPGNFHSADLRNDTLIIFNYGYYVYHVTGQEIGGITGVVSDSLTNLPIEGVAVAVYPDGSLDTTDENGRYSFDWLYDIAYHLTMHHQDYYDRNSPALTVIGSDTIEFDRCLLRKPYNDILAYQVISPPQFSDTGLAYYPSVILRNEGTEVANSVLAVLQVCESGTDIPFYVDSMNVLDIPRESIQTVTFGLPLSFHGISLYNLKLFLIYPGDENSANDSLNAVIDTRPAVEVWYGNPDGSPIEAPIGARVYIDVYAKTRPDVYVAALHLPLAVQDQYVDSLLSATEGSIYDVLTAWVDALFLPTIEHSPPNLPGWSSQSFLGYLDLKKSLWPPYCWPFCYLHSTTPVKILTFVIKTALDSTIVNDTIACLGPGFYTTLGGASAGDTVGGPGYKVTQYFSPLKFRLPYESCDYFPGDINNDGGVTPGDVTYGVRYFKSTGNPPPANCWDNLLEKWVFSAGDVNGDCEFRASDISYLVSFFKGINPTIRHCEHTPPR